MLNIKEFLKDIQKRYYSFLLTNRIDKNKNKIRKKKNAGKKIKVVFIAQFPEMWGSEKSLYEELKSNPRYEVTILSVPKHKYNGEKREKGLNNFSDINVMFEFLKSDGINSINAIQNNRCFRLSKIKPDIVFLQRPYEPHLPKFYSFSRLAKHSLLCYIPYDGIDLSKTIHLPIMINERLLRNCSCFFAPTSEQNSFFEKRKYAKNSESIIVGNPRFDLINPNEQKRIKKTFLWLPRWYFGNGENNKSNFIRYIHHLIEYFKNHQNLILIIRPHPLMFDSLLNDGVMDKNELDLLLNKIKETKNIQIDSNFDYLIAFNQSDVLISDYTSLLLDYFITSKPIIYCGEKDCFNEIGSLISRTFYFIDSWKELEDAIHCFANDIEQPDVEKLKVTIIHKILNNKAKASFLISEYLKNI